MIKIKSDINLKDTITCGQIFRYIEEIDDSYTIILSDRVVNLKKENDFLLVKSNNEDNLRKIIIEYLDLDRNYEELNKDILKFDSSLKKIIDKCNGFKIINSPKFETIISYIISQNNRVPQIQKALNNISEKYGDKIIFNNKEYFLFPNLIQLKNVKIEDYRALKVGFRDKYIYYFIQKLLNKEFDLEIINKMNTKDALNYLMTNNGIGEKIASCILLFSYRKYDCFPIDTWVKKYMKEQYNIEGVKNIRNFAKNKFGIYSGIVIQYIFHYNRNKNIID